MFGFIAAAVLGFLTPQFQVSVAPAITKALSFLKIEEGERDVIGFMVALIAAALVATIFSSGSALGVAVGVIVGYFATRLIGIVREATSGRPNS